MIGSTTMLAQDEEKQERSKKMDRAEVEKAIKVKKIAYITESLELTPDEAEKFWPIYNEFESKKMAVTKDMFMHFDKKEEKPEKAEKTEEPKEEK